MDSTLVYWSEQQIIETAIKFAYTPMHRGTRKTAMNELKLLPPLEKVQFDIDQEMGFDWIGGRTPRRTNLSLTYRLKDWIHDRLEDLIRHKSGDEALLVSQKIDFSVAFLERFQDPRKRVPVNLVVQAAWALLTDQSLPYQRRIWRCIACRGVFLAPTNHRRTLCSEGCRKKNHADVVASSRSQDA